VSTTQPEAIEQYSSCGRSLETRRAKPATVRCCWSLKDRTRLKSVMASKAFSPMRCERIINTITPLFRQGNFFGGVSAAWMK
jgi:hypothetical protein